jgi:aminoglycoside/choline kinase family phosphotransferase
MEGGDTLSDIKSYIAVGEFLFKYGLGGPEILSYDEERQIVLLEDLGDVSLYVLLQGAPTRTVALNHYKQVLEFLAEMQMRATRSIQNCQWVQVRSFGYEALRWETDYFTECFLKQFCEMPIAEQAELDREFHLLADALTNETRYFMHRDFQSQNIFIKDGRVRIVDFQSATMGMRQYDAAALLKDAYYVLEEGDREMLLRFYIETLRKTWGQHVDENHFVQTFQFAGLQRNMQALGAFAYLTLARGKKHFSQYIPNALYYLHHALEGICLFPVLKELVSQAVKKNKNMDARLEYKT